MRASEPGEAAILLPWLAPGVASLVALARSNSADVWPLIRTDPGAVLLLARHLSPGPQVSIAEAVFRSPEVLETALRLWRDGHCQPVDWSVPDAAVVYQAALASATLSELLAKRAGGCEPACAWTGGLLAPLGWLAVCAIDPLAAGECLREPVYAEHFGRVQREHWRLDAPAIARRLARRWHLPDWLRAVAGHLGLHADQAGGVGADDRLFRIVQLAVILARGKGHDLGLPVGTDERTLVASLRLSEDDVGQVVAESSEAARTSLSYRLTHGPSLLPELLAVAIEKRNVDDGPFGERLEAEVDRLQEALAAQRGGETERLRRLKLRALAEFAAGAGHEINNPLAVISGHSQYLLNREADAGRQESLRGIIRQTERIHQLLTELMQFARPAQPRRQHTDLRLLIRESVARQQPTADSQGVRLEFHDYPEPIPVHADPQMILTALGCLVRNALEAAPKGGWARVSVEAGMGEWQVVVEDSGYGPPETRREHLFDPFYSGRQAGRGRGLGLPTAWRLVQENGGDVRYSPGPSRPARFVLSLPICAHGIDPHPAPHEEWRKTA